MAVARSSFGGVARRYIFPVLWMTSRLIVVGRMGRLHHINNGANAPWKKGGGKFLQELRGKCINLLYKIKKIFYTGTREFDNILAIYLSKIPFHLILRKIFKFLATRCQILRLKCTKVNFGWGSAPDPTGLQRSPDYSYI